MTESMTTWCGNPDHDDPCEACDEILVAGKRFDEAVDRMAYRASIDLPPVPGPMSGTYDPEWVRALIEDRARLQVELQVARGEGGFVAKPPTPADPLTQQLDPIVCDCSPRDGWHQPTCATMHPELRTRDAEIRGWKQRWTASDRYAAATEKELQKEQARLDAVRALCAQVRCQVPHLCSKEPSCFSCQVAAIVGPA